MWDGFEEGREEVGDKKSLVRVAYPDLIWWDESIINKGTDLLKAKPLAYPTPPPSPPLPRDCILISL